MNETVWVKELSCEELIDGKLAAVQGLQGRWKRWVTPDESNFHMVFGMGELSSGEVAEWHEHPQAEIFFVLTGSGKALWRVDGQEHQAELRPGVAFYKIGGVPHKMTSLGEVPLRGVFFKVGEA